jgi:G3E family GTPase
MVIEHNNLRMQTRWARPDCGDEHLEVRMRPGQNLSAISKTHAGRFDHHVLPNILHSSRWLTDPGYIRIKQIMRIRANHKVASEIQSAREPGAVLRKFAGHRENQ